MTAARTSTLDGLSWSSLEAQANYKLYQEARRAVLAVLTEAQDLSLSIPAFNDADERTFDEVREVLEKTRAALQERGQ